jgi:transglutaminase-like putative cysteine protease
MRIQILHDTLYTYAQPARSVVQVLRMTPRSFEGHHVLRWRIEPNVDGRFLAQEDAQGNSCHRFFTETPVEALRIRVAGDVETAIDNGVVRGLPEKIPVAFYLRETPLTQPDTLLRDFALSVSDPSPADPLAVLHKLMEAVHKGIIFDTEPTHAATTAVEALALGKGVCQDLSHIFLSAARLLDIPARYVSGYFRRNDGIIQQEASHAWAEAYVQDLGWVGFDPANGICMGNQHLRVASGLDYLDAAPIRGARYGGGAETLAVSLHVDFAGQQ